ncbi:MAG: inositol monophosphatase family protein, partial [Phycisphaerales bacterium]
MIHSELLLTMRTAVSKAALATRAVHSDASIAGIAKDDRSPVTVADWASQAVVALVLRASPFADVSLVGEEEAAALRAPESSELRARVVAAVSRALGPVTEHDVLHAIDHGRGAPAERFLTLDPVDGTKGFLRRQQYAISLALIEHGTVAAGVVGCPNLASDGADYDRAAPPGTFAVAARGAGADP